MWTSTLSKLALLLVAQNVVAIPYYYGEKKDDNGAVASEAAVCSEIGVDLMKRGGNAADAIVGTAICAGTVAMYHSGIGGGGFALIRSPIGVYDFIDFRETAPALSSEDMFANNTAASIRGGLASATPGELRGLAEIHTRYGSLPWAELIEPSIKLARDGFTVTEDLVAYMNHPSGPFPFLTEDPSWAQDFAPNGERVKLGDTMYRKRYADTLETIADMGVEAFYDGPIADATVRKLESTGGIMTLEDLAAYEIVHRQPVDMNYRGLTLTSCSAPSGGPVVLSTLNVWQGFDEASVDIKAHRLVESMKFAYGQRSLLGDPSFNGDITTYQESMFSPAVGDEIRSKIKDDSVLDPKEYDPAGLESLETPGTSHMVSIDKGGLAISMTSTINLIFGSQVMIPETGIIMNNEMNDFSIPGTSNAFGFVPSAANYIRPGKRPLSSMSPSIVENADGSINFVIGAAGGSRIITATIQNIIHVIDEGLSAYEAIALPRLHNQLTPNTTFFEYKYDNTTVAALKGRGQVPVWVAPGQSTAQGIRRLQNGTFEAASEPRQKNSGGVAF
ncbi:gamma-glutamyltranspeptidase [Morchella conica CCBAS932]|uniref:Glutathione hydrolase n=1 Tax=Morchella conica CCBAS932 TaxID=1392247 RepID=A0A3N4KSF9_9PEZI|nr:gamma-glutamyltranspeptidase [Morchella conica CCBAS932]